MYILTRYRQEFNSLSPDFAYLIFQQSVVLRQLAFQCLFLSLGSAKKGVRGCLTNFLVVISES